MLNPALPASATTSLHATATPTTAAATPASPTRPSRLRGLSYLRSYTREHLHSHSLSSTRADAPPLTRSTSSPVGGSRRHPPGSRSEGGGGEGSGGIGPSVEGSGWMPSARGGTTSTSNETAAPGPATATTDGNMSRSRAVTAVDPTAAPVAASARRQSAADAAAHGTAEITTSTPPPLPPPPLQPTIKFIPHIETRSSRPSLHFTAMSRTLPTPTSIIRVGRYSERDNNNNAATQADPSVLPVGFKSKVVSRRHCEFWCTAGQWYIKDVKSSSGTFLNHVRLSAPGQESRPFEVNDGDTVQLGIDFKGGEEVIFRCVKIRIECNRGWQKSLNAYNTTAHKRLLKSALGKKSRDSDAQSVNSSECSICLNPVAPCQALFVAPCSHVWHYKCVRNLVHGPHYPNFLCPNCRFVADLEADVEPPEEDEGDFEEVQESGEGQAEAGGEEEEGDGRSTPRAGRRDENGNMTDEALSNMLTNTSINEPPDSSEHGQAPTSSTDLSDQTPSSATSLPMNITRPPTTASSTLSPAGARSTTPTSTTQFALAVGVNPLPEGLMTPRNDAGPFVLDGSGGRGAQRLGPVGEESRRGSEEEGLGHEVPEEGGHGGNGDGKR